MNKPRSPTRGCASARRRISRPSASTACSIDARADVYGAGVLLYEMLAGMKPFVGATPLEYHFARAAVASVPHARCGRIRDDVTALARRRDRPPRAREGTGAPVRDRRGHGARARRRAGARASSRGSRSSAPRRPRPRRSSRSGRPRGGCARGAGSATAAGGGRDILMSRPAGPRSIAHRASQRDRVDRRGSRRGYGGPHEDPRPRRARRGLRRTGVPRAPCEGLRLPVLPDAAARTRRRARSPTPSISSAEQIIFEVEPPFITAHVLIKYAGATRPSSRW